MSQSIFVDTNYFLRFLIKDISSQQKQAKNLFLQAAEGEVSLFSNTVVLFEVFWVMSSFYEKSKMESLEIIQQILRMGFVEFEGREVLAKALNICRESALELEDCYHISFAQKMGCENYATFDKEMIKYLRSHGQKVQLKK